MPSCDAVRARFRRREEGGGRGDGRCPRRPPTVLLSPVGPSDCREVRGRERERILRFPLASSITLLPLLPPLHASASNRERTRETAKILGFSRSARHSKHRTVDTLARSSARETKHEIVQAGRPSPCATRRTRLGRAPGNARGTAYVCARAHARTRVGEKKEKRIPRSREPRSVARARTICVRMCMRARLTVVSRLYIYIYFTQFILIARLGHGNIVRLSIYRIARLRAFIYNHVTGHTQRRRPCPSSSCRRALKLPPRLNVAVRVSRDARGLYVNDIPRCVRARGISSSFDDGCSSVPLSTPRPPGISQFFIRGTNE